MQVSAHTSAAMKVFLTIRYMFAKGTVRGEVECTVSVRTAAACLSPRTPASVLPGDRDRPPCLRESGSAV